jgi:hypothetical protein
MKKRYVLEAQHTDLGLWKIMYKRISTIQIMTLTATSSSTLSHSRTLPKCKELKAILALNLAFLNRELIIWRNVDRKSEMLRGKSPSLTS